MRDTWDWRRQLSSKVYSGTQGSIGVNVWNWVSRLRVQPA